MKNALHHVIFTIAGSATPAGRIVYLDIWYDQLFRYSIAGSAALTVLCLAISTYSSKKKKEK